MHEKPPLTEIGLRQVVSQRMLRLGNFLCVSKGKKGTGQLILPSECEIKKPRFQFNLKKTTKKRRQLTGDIRYHYSFASRYLQFERDIVVYLPPSYNQSKSTRYPVLYMHDGNNIFDPQTSFAGVPWAVNDTVEELIEKKSLQEIIVVGIHNTPARLYEYTWEPMELAENEIHGGYGKKYARFLVEELKMFIDRTYRTLSDRHNTATMGSSLGGLISFYLGCHYGDVFSKIGLMSPSLWWGYGAPLKHVSRLRKDLKIWIDMGALESGSRDLEMVKETLHMTRLMRHYLLDHGYREHENFMYFEDQHGFHDERSWSRRVHRPLLFFFKAHD